MAKEMTTTRMFPAPAQKVWDAWTKSEYFSLWFGHPLRTKAGSTHLDVRPQGAWQSTMIAADGHEMPFQGKYLNVSPPELLIMTFEDANNPPETLTIKFEGAGAQTKVTIHQAGSLPDEEYIKLVEGYNNFMDGLEKILASVV